MTVKARSDKLLLALDRGEDIGENFTVLVSVGFVTQSGGFTEHGFRRLCWLYREEMRALERKAKEAPPQLTPVEALAVLAAVDQMTGGNARSFDEWRKATSGTRHEWDALIRGEKKLRRLI